MLRDLANMLRRPEYTGDNRCLPCTVVNTILAVVAGIVISRKSRPTGLVVFLASAVLIYLRGYLLPGTPQLTKRYLPPAVLRWFGKAPDADLARGLCGMDDPEESADHQEDAEQSKSNAQKDPRSPDGEKTVPDDLDSHFEAANIVESRADGDDLSLTTAFETSWFEMIETVDESDDMSRRAVDAFGIEATPDELDFSEHEDGAYALQLGTQFGGEWPSYAALVADLAAGELLDDWLDEWTAYSPKHKGDVLNELRTFLETCPTAASGLRRIERDDDSCCGLSTVVSVVCDTVGRNYLNQASLRAVFRHGCVHLNDSDMYEITSDSMRKRANCSTNTRSGARRPEEPIEPGARTFSTRAQRHRRVGRAFCSNAGTSSEATRLVHLQEPRSIHCPIVTFIDDRLGLRTPMLP